MSIRHVLFIVSDQHRGDCLGAAGHPCVQTPHLDRLAERGTHFTNAYSVSPICGPARACLATSRYPHEVDSYGNATCYNGKTPSVAHHLSANGITAASVGRMDFLPGIDHGYDAVYPRPRDPLAIAEFLRSPSVKRHDIPHAMLRVEHLDDPSLPHPFKLIMSWLDQERRHAEPWHLFVNFVKPHCPFIVPKKYVALYDGLEIPLPVMPKGYLENPHPALKEQRFHWNIEELRPDDELRLIRKSYYAMITWVDDAIGRILGKLEEQGILDETLVIYSSDHGDHLGDHGLWQKCNLLDSCARVPLLIAGPGVPAGHKIDTPVNHLDISPTILTAMGCSVPEEMRGQDLLALTGRADEETGRAVFGEYHGPGAVTGEFMVRQGPWKYIHYEGMRPQLFDLQNDPGESNDLGEERACAQVRDRYDRMLREEFGDLADIDARIRAYQLEQFKVWWQSGDPQERTAELVEFAGGDREAIAPHLRRLRSGASLIS
jgi:choline-sulfatase